MRAELAQFAKQSTELYPLSLYENLRSRLRAANAENERLSAQVISWHTKHDAYFIQRSDELKKIMAEERDRWIEQAEKLASSMEDLRKPGFATRPVLDEVVNRALAAFEAFKERIKN